MARAIHPPLAPDRTSGSRFAVMGVTLIASDRKLSVQGFSIVDGEGDVRDNYHLLGRGTGLLASLPITGARCRPERRRTRMAEIGRIAARPLWSQDHAVLRELSYLAPVFRTD